MSLFHKDVVYAELRPDGRIQVDAKAWRRDQIGQIPGSAWRKSDDTWSVPCAWTACLALRGTFEEALQIGPSLEQWATVERNSRVVPCRTHRLDLDAPGDPLLRPFQRADVMWLKAAKRAILANGTGSGKTVSACVALRELNAVPAVVFCMKNMVIEWARHLEKWGRPEWKIQIVSGGAAERRRLLQVEADVYVMHYDVALAHSRLAPYGNIRLTDKDRRPKELNVLGLRTVVADEAHLLADPQAKRTRALWASAFGSEIEVVWGLTATPLTTDLGSTWSMLHFISSDEWPAKTKFIDRYVERGWNMWGGMELLSVKPDTAGEFFAGFEPRFRRIPEEIALPLLPPVVREIRKIPMEAKQASTYAQLSKTMIAELESGPNLVVTRAAELFLRLRQLASSMIEVENYTDDEGNHRQQVELTTPSNKITAVLEILEESPDESIIVFAEHRKLIELLAKKLTAEKIPFSKVVGGQTIDERQEQVDAFQAGKTKLIIATIAAGGTGLTLTAATTTIYIQRHTQMVLNIQGDGRSRRIGSERHARIRYIEVQSVGSVDARVLELMHDKKLKLEDLVRDKEALEQLLTMPDTPVDRQLELYEELANTTTAALTAQDLEETG